MLNIIERFVKNNGWSYGRLDGSTPVGTRQASQVRRSGIVCMMHTAAVGVIFVLGGYFLNGPPVIVNFLVPESHILRGG